MKWSFSIIAILLLYSCKNRQESSLQGEWIQGTNQEKINIIESQLGGFDKAMVETGYRYQELYWAGQDENWPYAYYQLEKIRKAIRNGLERRPKRSKSATYFMTVSLPAMEKALKEKDTAVFNDKFQTLTNSCISCHAMEKVSHFTVKKPLYRPSPIRK